MLKSRFWPNSTWTCLCYEVIALGTGIFIIEFGHCGALIYDVPSLRTRSVMMAISSSRSCLQGDIPEHLQRSVVTVSRHLHTNLPLLVRQLHLPAAELCPVQVVPALRLALLQSVDLPTQLDQWPAKTDGVKPAWCFTSVATLMFSRLWSLVLVMLSLVSKDKKRQRAASRRLKWLEPRVYWCDFSAEVDCSSSRRAAAAAVAALLPSAGGRSVALVAF